MKKGAHWRMLAAAAVVVAFAYGCGSQPDVDHGGSLVSEEGQIAFTRVTGSPGGEEGADIYVREAGGTNQERLTSAPGFEGFPAWSADGERIAFVSARKGDG